MTTRIQKPTAVRREEIIQAVLRIITEQGVTALTTSNLASEVGVSSGALFRHFRSREEILTATTRYAVERINQTFPDASLPPRDRLFTMIENRVRVLGSDPGLAWLLRSDQALLTLPQEGVALLRELIAKSKQFMLQALSEAAAEGSIRNDIPPRVLAVVVMGTVHTLIGMSGVANTITEQRTAVLNALARLLAPPSGPGSRVTQREGLDR